MTHWHQRAWGDLPDGSRIMLVHVEADDWPVRRRKTRSFEAVLICTDQGLHRLWRSGRSRLLASGYQWPELTRGEAEKSLGPLVPPTWGTQRGSGCVIKALPLWILKARTKNLARLMLAWSGCEHAANTERARAGYVPLALAQALPASPLWRPVAITVVPNTDVVVRALHSGVLLGRLKRGLERIYVSQMAWIRAPSVEASLRALAHRFPARLVLVRAEAFKSLSQILRVTRARAAEFQFIGSQLRGRYLEDFGYDLWDNPAALEGMIRLRIGEIPRGTGMLWLHEMPVELDRWAALDVDAMLSLEHDAKERHEAQDRRAMEAIQLTAAPEPDSSGVVADTGSDQ